jgi:hypothetical protein
MASMLGKKLARIEPEARLHLANAGMRPLAERFPDDPIGYCKHVWALN